MKVDWAGWDNGRKLLFVVSCVALVSFFLPWTKSMPRGSFTFAGYTQGWPMLGLLGFAFPLFQLLKGGAINKIAGYAGAVFAIALGIYFVATGTTPHGADMHRVAVTWGSYVYVLSCAALAVSVNMAE